MELLFAVAAAVALVSLWATSRAAITVCVLDVTSGHTRLRRGALAPRVLADIADVIRKADVARARLRIVRDSGAARLEITGVVADADRQRLRNVVGSLPLAQLANGRRAR